MGKVPLVRIEKGKPDPADVQATRLLYESNLVDGVFKCPRCGREITNPNDAIDHLKDEINETMTKLPSIIKAAKPKEK